MSESSLNLFLAALAVFAISIDYLFLGHAHAKRNGNSVFWFLLVASSIFVIWGIVFIVLSLIKGIELNIARPPAIAFISSILILLPGIYELKRKKKYPQHSRFIPYSLIVYSSIIVIWGSISFLVIRAVE